ncbi:MAG: lipopolysaccharide biosynthesis protein [Pseudomonadota bacterium]|nr:lipopolysaccharide biosynthesis protein [Pseudomonadota bacterium]
MTSPELPPTSPDQPAGAEMERPGLRHLSHGRLRASISGVAWSLLSVMTSTIMGVVVYVVTSRVLAPSDFGLVAFGSSIVLLGSCIVPFGFGTALTQREEVTEEHLHSVFWLCAVAGCTVYALLVIMAGLLADLTNTEGLALVLAPLGIRLLSDSMSVVPAALLFRRMLFRAFAIRSMIANGLGGIICLAMVWAGAGLWALITAQVLGSVVNLIVVWGSAGWLPRFVFRPDRVRELAAFGLSSTGTRIVNELRVDHFLIGMVAGPSVLGLYFFARRLFFLLLDLTAGVFSPVANVLFASTQSEPEKARQAFQMGGFVVAAVGLPLFAGMLAVADTAVPHVFGAQWSGAVLAVRILTVSGLFAVLGIVQAGLINGRGHAGWWLGYQATLQFATVPVVILLYPFYGLNGIVGGMAAVTILLWPVSTWKALALLDLPLRDYLRNLAGPVAATGIMWVAVSALPYLQPQLTGMARLLVEIAVGSGAYGLCLLVLSRHHMRHILGAVQRRHDAPS